MLKVGESVDVKTRRIPDEVGRYTPTIGIVVGISKRWVLPTRYLIRYFPTAGMVIQAMYREEWFYGKDLVKLHE